MMSSEGKVLKLYEKVVNRIMNAGEGLNLCLERSNSKNNK